MPSDDVPNPLQLEPLQRQEFAEQVKYEADMLAAASIWQHRLSTAKRQDWINMGLETALFHQRNLMSFLLNKTGIDNEVVAKVYVTDWLSRFGNDQVTGAKAAAAAQARLRATEGPINEHLAHLTTSRLVRHYQWDTPGAVDDVLHLLKFFRAALIEQKSPYVKSFAWIPALAREWPTFRPRVDRFVVDGQRVLCIRKDTPRPAAVDPHLGQSGGPGPTT
jgi:hypothetical protein